MTFSVAFRLSSRRCPAAALVFVTTAAALLPAGAAADEQPRDRVRAELALDATGRTFELRGPSEVLFDAPFYPGLSVGLVVFPVALFARDHVASGLGVELRTTKHTLNTVAAVEVEDETYDFDVPTRHDITHFGARYEWRVSDALTLTPSVGWRAEEVGLAYNSLYRNSFYRGVDVGLAGAWAPGPTGLTVDLGLGVRPSVDIGSTVEPYGDSASSFGLGVKAGLGYRSALGLYGKLGFELSRYSTTYRPDRNTDREDSESTDRFQSFVFTLGYAY
ncbi:MAG: outer membrane beta-barrel protein [Myxococcales bacterium]|nr:outer membrane beta-barrel protein [Myxococcales bacterium]MCB9519308.1 outer membrane beta-barrel protein [Myxococcales bacterium]MCB9530752.1 outer membrane beta-barrel protein [Myxococcales bacterium]MCB9533354.1 outer membrane beta-barrel protein [Myxococcales bacterium]